MQVGGLQVLTGGVADHHEAPPPAPGATEKIRDSRRGGGKVLHRRRRCDQATLGIEWCFVVARIGVGGGTRRWLHRGAQGFAQQLQLVDQHRQVCALAGAGAGAGAPAIAMQNACP